MAAVPKIDVQNTWNEDLSAQAAQWPAGNSAAALLLVSRFSLKPTPKIDEDFHDWLLDQAAALRARHHELLDWDHLAEELEIMGAQERRQMKDRLITLQEHLLKLKFETTEVHRHNSWRNTIEETRERIADILEDSPGIFQGKRDEVLAETYQRARKAAVRSTGLPLSTFPEVCPWTYDQAVDEDFVPGVTKSN